MRCQTPHRGSSSASACLLQTCAPGHYKRASAGNNKEPLKCNFSVFEYDLWGRSRAINKSAALWLDGLSEARRRLSIQGLHDGRLPVGTLVESHQDVRHSVDVQYVPATLQRVTTA